MKTILIADDTYVQLMTLRDTAISSLGHKDWVYECVSTLETAQEKVRCLNDISIAVIDLRLTDDPSNTDGLPLLEEIRERFPQSYRILVSSKLDNLALIEHSDNLFHEFLYLKRKNNINPYDRLVELLDKGRRSRKEEFQKLPTGV